MYEFDWSSIIPALPHLWIGMRVTLSITIVAIITGVFWGSILAVAREAQIFFVSQLATLYIDLFRSTPLVMVLLWFFLIAPNLIRSVFDIPIGTDLRLPSAMIGFALFESAYYSEIIRSGIRSLKKGQKPAAFALGMTYLQTMRYVILPQAFRAMIPTFLSQAIILFQDTSLVYVIGLADFFGISQKIGDRDGRLIEMLLFAGLMYFLICIGPSYAVERLKKRFTSNSKLQKGAK